MKNAFLLLDFLKEWKIIHPPLHLGQTILRPGQKHPSKKKKYPVPKGLKNGRPPLFFGVWKIFGEKKFFVPNMVFLEI